MILFTALIGPHFVDWTSYRDTFEREASAYVGRPVTVAGKVGVRLLPTPVVSFTDIVVGDPKKPDVRMERFRAEIELTPLLSGQVRVVQMTMERPVFHVDIGDLAAHSGALSAARGPAPEHVSLERLEIVDGSASVAYGADRREVQARNIDAVVEADTLMGPGRVTANLTLAGAPVAVSVAFGRLTDREVITKLSVRSPKYPVSLTTEGQLQFAADAPPKYEGTATVAGIEPEKKDAPRSPWADFRASGAFALNPVSLAVSEMQISYGGTERPLILQTAGKIDFSPSPRFDVTLAARQIDIDRTLGGGAEQPVAIEAAVRTLAEKIPDVPTPKIPGVLHLRAQGAVVGGGVIQSVSADLSTGDRAWHLDDFSATLPGETEVGMSGTIGIDPETTFEGHARIASNRPAALASWWRGEVGSASKIGRFSVEADVDLRPGEQRLANLVAATGVGTMRGSVEIRRFSQSGNDIVAVDLGADRADLEEARALGELFTGKSFAAGSIEQMTLSLKADVLSAGGVDAHSVAVEGVLAGGEFNLGRLTVADLAGASIDARGNIKNPLDKPTGEVYASIQAENFEGAAAFLASLMPQNRIVQRLHQVAPILSPVSADISAKAGEAGGQISLSLTGSFAATHVTLVGEGSGSLGDPSTLAGSLKLHADGADSGTVLRQLGIAALPVRSGPLALDADFEGALAKDGKLTLEGSVAGVDVSYDGTTAERDGVPAVKGAFTAKSKDIDPALLLAGISVPGIGEGHAASASGGLEYSAGTIGITLAEGTFDGEPMSGALSATFAPAMQLSGNLDLTTLSAPTLAGFGIGAQPGVGESGWSDAPFAVALPQGMSLDLALNAATLDLGGPVPAKDAKLDAQLADGKLQLDLASAVFAGGVLKGTLSATLADGAVDLSVRGGLKGGALDELVWERSGVPIASGTLDASFDMVGRGRSTAGVVATLSGSGSFSIDAGRINVMNPDALNAVMSAAEGPTEPDDLQARETFATLFGSGALNVGRVAGSFAIANGSMSIPTVSMQSGETAILADARFDLSRLTLESQWVVRNGGSGSDEGQPYVPIHFSGDIADPDRQVDLEPLLNLLRSRFLQRQLKELEELEAVRKRVEAEEAARQAEEARKAEEAKRAAEEQGLPLEDPAPPPAATPDEPPTTGATPSDPNAMLLDAAPMTTAPGADPLLLTPPIDLLPDTSASIETLPVPDEANPLAEQMAPAPDETAPEAAPPRRAATPRPVKPTPPAAEYRTLPNGTIVKIR